MLEQEKLDELDIALLRQMERELLLETMSGGYRTRNSSRF